MRREVAGLDPQVPIYGATSIEHMIADSTPVFLRRYLSFLIGGFGALAALLAAVGVYGVTSYSVEQRRHEIGLRVALGAAPRQVLGLILGQGLRLAALGVALGLLAAIPATRALTGVLFGVSTVDPAVLVGVVVLLTGVVLLACGIPARRADPLIALRSE